MKKFLSVFFILQLSASFGYNLDFFEKFDDKYLTGYIQEALSNNHTLKQSAAIVEQYRLEINSQFASEFPSLSVSSNYLGAHFPSNDISFFPQKNSFILPFIVNWEADFLLKTKDKIKSKKYLYKSQLAIQDAIYISMLTDLANAYLNIILYDYLIKKQNEIVSLKQQNYLLNNSKYKFGTIDLISLNNSKEEINNQKIILENLIKKRKIILNNFSLLLGRSANCSNEIKRGDIETFEFKDNIPKTINSNLIYFRPDVIEIESKLKSAKIDVTIAKKDFFPSFNITGLLAFDTSGAGNFFDWSSSFAFLIAGATQDIFKGGEKIANLKIKKAKYAELVEKYKQTDLNAIKEIADALQIIDKDTKNDELLLNQLFLKRNDFKLSAKRYKSGIYSKIEYLNDKNILLEQEQLKAISKTQRLCDYFTLYKAVGGQL